MSLPDVVRFHPSRLGGVVHVPGDKSLSHRALMIPALCGDPVAVSGLADGADVRATAAALTALGVTVRLSPDARGDLAGTVEGDLGRPGPGAEGDPVQIDCGNSGSTLRMLAGLAAGAGRAVTLSGDASLRRRPVGRIAAPLEAAGLQVSSVDGHPPLTVVPTAPPRAVRWDSPVASAQVKSAVLLCGLGAPAPSTVTSPAPSRDHTERLLRAAGIEVTTEIGASGDEVVTISPGRPRLTRVDVGRDPSAAAFWHVAAACAGGAITTPGLCLNPGRTGALEVLGALGADVAIVATPDVSGEPVGDVTVTAGPLGGAEVAGPLVVRTLDELPVLALAGAFAADGLHVRDAGELRVKESDRIAGIAALLEAVGVDVEAQADGFRVTGGQRPSGGTVHVDGDHRIAMTAALAGILGSSPVEVHGFATVASSYPRFLADLTALGGEVEVRHG